jgi:hypothetical protein
VDRKCTEKKYYGAELGITEAIQGTTSMRATIELAEGAYWVCHASFPDVRLETENMRRKMRIAGTVAEDVC